MGAAGDFVRVTAGILWPDLEHAGQLFGTARPLPHQLRVRLPDSGVPQAETANEAMRGRLGTNRLPVSQTNTGLAIISANFSCLQGTYSRYIGISGKDVYDRNACAPC